MRPGYTSTYHSDRPILIVGCPRSGTSLFSKIIDHHPRITIPFESHVYKTFYPWQKYYGDLRLEQNRERLVDDILSTEVIKDWSPSPERQRVLAAIKRYDFHGVFEGLMSAWTDVQGKQRWGEKTPAHIFYWREILEGFPHLQVLHIVRDGRDVALSWKRARFGPKHIYSLARQWVQYLETIEKLRSALDEDSFLEIRYEELLSKPKHILQDICHFLGEEFTTELLSFYTIPSSYPTDKQNEQNLSQPLLASNAGKWRTEMTARELRVFEAVAGSTLERYGYARQLDRPSLLAQERMQFRYLEHPPRKIYAMLRNRKGQIDGIRKLQIYLRLRLGL